ncbi:MAG: hypothetical protein Crog4KO_25790 [Crocinitomicaceae bacterium]
MSSRAFERINPDNFTVFDYRKTRTRFEHGFNLKYAFKIFKKRNLFAIAGYDFSTVYFNHQLIDPKYNRHLNEIDIISNQSTIRIGLNQQLPLYNEKVRLNFGIHILQNFAHKSETRVSEDDVQSNVEWIRYSYKYDLFEGDYYENEAFISNRQFNRINSEFSFDIMFKLKTGFISAGMAYTRNNYRFYDYFARFEYFEGGSPFPTETYTINEGELKTALRDHFIRFRLGYVVEF